MRVYFTEMLIDFIAGRAMIFSVVVPNPRKAERIPVSLREVTKNRAFSQKNARKTAENACQTTQKVVYCIRLNMLDCI